MAIDATMLTRRKILTSLPLAAVFAMDWRQVRALEPVWHSWRNTYLQNGRVIDPQQSRITHSEGQGYGLLLAQAFGDRSSFKEIEDWTETNLALRDDNLMAWAYRPHVSGASLDRQTATDGDLFRAWALLRAERDSGWAGYGEKAIAIARDIATYCLVTDPRAPLEYLLAPGAESRRGPDRVLHNPSYIMPRALRELGVAAADPRLIRAADHGETVLSELAATGLLPNWIDVTVSGFVDPREHEVIWGYDALRIPLYLTWSGRRDHAAVALGLSLLTENTEEAHLAVEVTVSGDVRTQSNLPGYFAIVDVAACRKLHSSERIGQPPFYYPDTLALLSDVATRESGCSL